jgi:hypothetical protein
MSQVNQENCKAFQINILDQKTLYMKEKIRLSKEMSKEFQNVKMDEFQFDGDKTTSNCNIHRKSSKRVSYLE